MDKVVGEVSKGWVVDLSHANLIGNVIHHGSGDAHFLPGLVKEGSSPLPAFHKVAAHRRCW